MKRLTCILLVDDNHSTNFLHRKLIEKMDVSANIKVADSGDRAIQYLQQCTDATEGEFPDPELIFLDINMPRMNGWEFLEEYKKLQLHSVNRTIIMLTNSPNPGDQAKARAVPEISAYYNKPLSTAVISEILERYFEGVK